MARKISDDNRQLLQYIANRCNEASDCVAEGDKALNTILSLCDELADRINDYLELD